MSAVPRISVIVPVYNVAPYLRDCLDSVLRQKFGDFELICVDDGSTDGSSVILGEYAEKDMRVHIVRRANGGLSAARNSGLEVAVGEYVYFLDGDDSIVPDALERLCSLVDREQMDQIVFSTEISVEENAATEERLADMRRYYCVPDAVAGRVMTGQELFTNLVLQNAFFASAPLRLFRRSALPAGLRFPEGLLHEDNYFTPLALLSAKKAMAIPDRLYLRRVRKGSIMTEPGQERRHAEGFFHVRLELARRFRFAVGGSVLRRACDAYLAELQRLYAACGVDVRSGAGNLSPVRKVSVVMPVFNSGTALVPCLESVLSQTYRDIEVVCVDDGSTDGSADVLADFAARDVRVRVVTRSHADAGTARNVGYAEATGDALLFLDSDDVFAPDMIATLVRGLDDGFTEIAVCGWEDFADGSPVPSPDAGNDAWEVVDEPAVAADVYDRWMGWAWDKLVRRSLIEREGLKFQSLRSSNDMAFAFAALVCARRVSQTRRRLVAHRKSAHTISATRDRDPLCFAAALREHHAFLVQRGLMGSSSFLARDFRRYALIFAYWHLDTMETDNAYSHTYYEVRKILEELSLPDALAGIDADDDVLARCRCLHDHETPLSYLRTLQPEVMSLRQMWVDMRRKIETLRDDNETLRRETETLRRKIETLRDDNETLRRETGTLRREKNNLQTAFHAMKASLSFRIGRIITFPLRVIRNVLLHRRTGR